MWPLVINGAPSGNGFPLQIDCHNVGNDNNKSRQPTAGSRAATVAAVQRLGQSMKTSFCCWVGQFWQQQQQQKENSQKKTTIDKRQAVIVDEVGRGAGVDTIQCTCPDHGHVWGQLLTFHHPYTAHTQKNKKRSWKNRKSLAICCHHWPINFDVRLGLPGQLKLTSMYVYVCMTTMMIIRRRLFESPNCNSSYNNDIIYGFDWPLPIGNSRDARRWELALRSWWWRRHTLGC